MADVPGFRPQKRGGAGATSPMSHHPNADLIGLTFPVDTGGEGTVVGTWALNPQYVEVDTPRGRTLRVAAQVRRRKELT